MLIQRFKDKYDDFYRGIEFNDVVYILPSIAKGPVVGDKVDMIEMCSRRRLDILCNDDIYTVYWRPGRPLQKVNIGA